MICWKMVQASSSGILCGLKSTSCFWRYSRRAILTTCTPLWGKVVWAFQWFHIVVWCWGAWWVWGCGFRGRRVRRQPRLQFSIYPRFWWRLFLLWGCGWLIWLCRRCLCLEFCLGERGVTDDVAADGACFAWVEFLCACFHIFVHYLSDCRLIILCGMVGNRWVIFHKW